MMQGVSGPRSNEDDDLGNNMGEQRDITLVVTKSIVKQISR